MPIICDNSLEVEWWRAP